MTAPLLQTDSAAVSTVVDQQVVSNMPLNGRSFQSLIALTPGIVFTSQNLGQGQFSASGQYVDTNYFMVDGVSANFATTTFILGQTLGGALPAFTAQGGTNGSFPSMPCRSSVYRRRRMRPSKDAHPGPRSRLSRNPARISFTAVLLIICGTISLMHAIILTVRHCPSRRCGRTTLAGPWVDPS